MTDQTEYFISLVLDGMVIAVEMVGDRRLQGLMFLPRATCTEEQAENGLDVYEIREIAAEYRRKGNAKWN